MCTEAFDIWRKENADKLKEASNLTYSSVYRVGEISVATPKEAVWLCGHHTIQAAVELRRDKARAAQEFSMDQTAYDQRQRIVILRDQPKYLRNRLDPVFSRPDVFDPQGWYKNRFAEWERAYSDRLDKIDFWTTGKGSVARRHREYINVFNDTFNSVDCIVNDMLDDLGVEAAL